MSEKKIDVTGTENTLASRQKPPLVFISHDTRDAEIAECFSRLLSGASAGILKSFRSSDKKGSQGIQYGVEWYPEIMGKLDNATDVVCLLTRNSIARPWILFEAGVAKGKLDTPVLGIAIGVPLKNASTGPFAQFQNCVDDEDSVTKLVMQLVSKIPDSEPDIEVIKGQVSVFLSKVQTISKSATSKDSPEEITYETSVAKLFEEIKVMYSELPDKINKSTAFSDNRRFPRRINLRFLSDIAHTATTNRTKLYILLSSFRDEMPWIYDLGIDVLRTRNTHSPIFLEKYKELISIIRYSSESLMHKEMGAYYQECSYLLMREFGKMLNDDENENNCSSSTQMDTVG